MPPEAAETDRPTRIRGHHLLCMLGFRGLGYSEEFVANMTRLVSTLQSSPAMSIEVVASADAVCGACPHLSDGRCNKPGGAHASEWDTEVLRRTGFSPGDTVTVAEVYRAVADGVAEDEIGRDLCRGCQWVELGYCAQGLRALKAGGGIETGADG